MAENNDGITDTPTGRKNEGITTAPKKPAGADVPAAWVLYLKALGVLLIMLFFAGMIAATVMTLLLEDRGGPAGSPMPAGSRVPAAKVRKVPNAAEPPNAREMKVPNAREPGDVKK